MTTRPIVLTAHPSQADRSRVSTVWWNATTAATIYNYGDGALEVCLIEGAPGEDGFKAEDLGEFPTFEAAVAAIEARGYRLEGRSAA